MTEQQYLRLAYIAAHKSSDDPNTKNGSVLLLTSGMFFAGSNHFPEGVKKTPERLVSPEKLKWIEHAERDVIFRAAIFGAKTNNSILYCPYAACCDCARAIVLAGVRKVVAHKQCMDKMPERWRASVEAGNDILFEGGVELALYDGPIGGVEHLFDGQVWQP